MTTTTTPAFAGWPADATAFLAELAADNRREFWEAHRERYTVSVLPPLQALAVALRDEFGKLRIFRPHRDRRFRPDAEPYRTDAGGVLATPGGTPFAVVLSAGGLGVQVGPLVLDGSRLRRYRAGVDGPAGEELEHVLAGLREGPGLVPQPYRPLTGTPRGYPATHPRIGLLRQRGLQVGREWPAGAWLATPEPLERVRVTWRAAAPLAAWLDTHVGPPL